MHDTGSANEQSTDTSCLWCVSCFAFRLCCVICCWFYFPLHSSYPRACCCFFLHREFWSFRLLCRMVFLQLKRQCSNTCATKPEHSVCVSLVTWVSLLCWIGVMTDLEVVGIVASALQPTKQGWSKEQSSHHSAATANGRILWWHHNFALFVAIAFCVLFFYCVVARILDQRVV